MKRRLVATVRRLVGLGCDGLRVALLRELECLACGRESDAGGLHFFQRALAVAWLHVHGADARR